MNPPRRALVADDERHISRLVEANLTRQGYEVVCVDNGQAALDLLDREAFDLVVVDLVMPLVDGHEILKRIRTDDTKKAMKVIVFSTQPLDPEFAYPPDKWLQKPSFGPDDLKF